MRSRFFLVFASVLFLVILSGCFSQSDFSAKPASVLIVPHHLVAEKQIINGFRTVARPVKRIVLMGPNHFFRGNGQVISTARDWSTEKGAIISDKKFIQKMADKNFLTLEENILENDHAITALLPFVEEFFPHVEFVPLLVREPIQEDDARKLAKFFVQEFSDSDDTLIIASIDFSHYLPKEIANTHDEASLVALQNLDFDFFSHKIDADSPHILMILSEYLRARGHEVFTLLSHTNSANLGGNVKEISTTSHFVGYYSEGELQRKDQMVVLLASDPITNELLFKGGDFSIFSGNFSRYKNNSELNKIFDHFIDPLKSSDKPLILSKNNVQLSIFNNENQKDFSNDADAALWIGPEQNLSFDFSWNPKRGPAAIIVRPNGKSEFRYLTF